MTHSRERAAVAAISAAALGAGLAGGAWPSSAGEGGPPPFEDWPAAPAPAPASPDPAFTPLLPEPLAAAAGVPRDLLYAVLADGSLAAQYAVDGHLHTEVSGDSHTSLRELADTGARRGLDAIVLTDHNSVAIGARFAALDARRGPRARPILILGEEAGAAGGHVGLWNVKHHTRPRVFDPGDRVHSTLDVAAERNPDALSILNHPGWAEVGGPHWRAASFDPRLPGPKFEAIELWNGRLYLQHQTRWLIEGWIAMLDRGLRPSIVAASDAHLPGQVGTPRTIVLSPGLDPASLVASARAGRTYLTDDARIAFAVEDLVPGETLEAEASERPWTVKVSGWSVRGGTLRVLGGPAPEEVVLAAELAPGRFDLSLEYAPRAPLRDGWMRVEIVRKQLWKGKTIDFVALVSAPVYWDVPPTADFWTARPGAWKERRPKSRVARASP